MSLKTLTGLDAIRSNSEDSPGHALSPSARITEGLVLRLDANHEERLSLSRWLCEFPGLLAGLHQKNQANEQTASGPIKESVASIVERMHRSPNKLV